MQPTKSKTTVRQTSAGLPSSSLSLTIIVIGILLGSAFLLYQARSLWFTQDDAYISYRYAQNALAGNGLVFNAGERVEGYTNFLWVVWLMLTGSLGMSFDLAAKSLGIASAVGMVITTALIVAHSAKTLRLESAPWLAASAAVWVGANGALAYWAVSGLETALFGFLISLSLLLWLRSSRLTVVPIILSIMTRPEGGLIWICLIVAEWIVSRDKAAVKWLFGAVALALVPFAAFKLMYYGDLLPNPFHAKTGMSWEYFTSGILYARDFLRQYGLWALALVPLALSIRVQDKRVRVLGLLWLVFAVYVIMVGGDVLRPNRFFVPVLPAFVASCVIGIGLLLARWKFSLSAHVAFLMVVSWAGAGWALSTPELRATRTLELGLTDKMAIIARHLRSSEKGTFTVATSTIGRISYELPDCRVIDMLGLTDREIALNPEVIPGNASSWKERNYNATYVLAQNPEYVVFSTGYKPSAPAERAMLLHSRFRRNYFGFVIYEGDQTMPVFRRKKVDTAPDQVWPDVNFAHSINAAFNTLVTQDFSLIAEKFSQAHHAGPGDFGLAVAYVGNALNMKGDLARSMAYVDSAIAIDSFTVDAWQIKSSIQQRTGDAEGAAWSLAQLNRILLTAR